MHTAIHRFVEAARGAELPRVVTRLPSGWLCLGDPQITRGYCVLYPDPVVADLHELANSDRTRFLRDMALTGEALVHVTGCARVNYEMLGNIEPALHAHIIPRYAHEAEALRSQPVWLHDWSAAVKFDPLADAVLKTQLRAALEKIAAF